MTRQEALNALYENCKSYINGLYTPEKKILLFGEGKPGAVCALVGEAPGEQEALMGRPFVGKAGKTLDELLAASCIKRSELYVTNAVKFRPTAVSKAGRTVNRPPTREEIALFRPFLLKEIEIISPKIIITLGNVPLGALSGIKNATVGAYHGQLIEETLCKVPLFALYHPAAVIYNRTLKPEYENDLAKLSALMRKRGLA